MSNLLKHYGHESESPLQMAEYLRELNASQVPGPRERTDEDEKMRAFLRQWAGVRFDGDPVEAKS